MCTVNKLTSLSATAVPYISMDAVNTTSSYHWETCNNLKECEEDFYECLKVISNLY